MHKYIGRWICAANDDLEKKLNIDAREKDRLEKENLSEFLLLLAQTVFALKHNVVDWYK